MTVHSQGTLEPGDLSGPPTPHAPDIAYPVTEKLDGYGTAEPSGDHSQGHLQGA
jgi:hypothetical protein